ncbi:MotA/TolQ/ExbB proton channel family protein [Ruficoccus amylovorans]|uniref:MotA/TolQ/ExbB proton channel family protein n=1 Tax=Ruficoccus amylovorans TaxID=1804625 RepID=A0A842HI98_9BACT|nr:MotA/TolQ/ExbB proton channel family protein [Ruficoccus amylovorans]MBC2596079.1 MotA/TolQ/ExbB proton channel family protein [Ruficoccus amylovorans]
MHDLKKFILMLSLGLAAFFAAPVPVLAQDEPPAAQTEQTVEAEDDVGVSMSLWGLFQAGGWAMYILLVLSISGVGLIIYNLLMIREKPFLRPDLAQKLAPAMESLDFDGARKICEDNPAVLTNIISAGLDRIDGQHIDPESMKEAMEESSTEELAAPFVMINMLSLVATLSPMVGLLGTVSGMIKAFRAIAAQGMGQPQALADNISEALITTATGLIVAVPAMFFYIFFKNVYGKISSRVDKQVGDLFHRMMKGIRRHTS